MTRRILMLGGAIGDSPMIRAARRAGFHVTTLGSRPDDVGHHYSHAVVAEDYSNIDAVAAVVAREKFDYVFGGCNDFAAITAAAVNERFSLPYQDTVQISRAIHQKDAFRLTCRGLGLPTPRFVVCRGFDEALAAAAEFPLPFLVKPVDLTGGKGITKVDRREDVAAAIRGALAVTREPRVLLEEFLDGTRHAISSILVDHRPAFHFVDEEHYYVNPYLVSGASTTGRVTPAHVADLLRQLETLARHTGLKEGLLHVQFILAKNGPVLIDPCRRPPGDLYVLLVKFATGVDYPLAILNSALGLPYAHLLPKRHAHEMTRHCVMSTKPGRVAGLEISARVRPYIRGGLRAPVGTQIVNHLNEKAAILFIKYPTAQIRDELAESMPDHIKVNVTA